MDNTVLEWLKTSETDLGVAQHLFENYHPKPIEIVCYHCQQSAEKAIKAIPHNSARRFGEGFYVTNLLRKRRNTLCISRFRSGFVG